MKLRPNSAAGASCVRCNAPFDPAGVQVRATCSPCATDLRLMHTTLEYTMFRRTYYLCSTEGTSFDWLIANGYGKEITTCVGPYLPRVVPMVQVPMVQALVNSS